MVVVVAVETATDDVVSDDVGEDVSVEDTMLVLDATAELESVVEETSAADEEVMMVLEVGIGVSKGSDVEEVVATESLLLLTTSVSAPGHLFVKTTLSFSCSPASSPKNLHV